MQGMRIVIKTGQEPSLFPNLVESDEYRIAFSMLGSSDYLNLVRLKGFTRENEEGEDVFADRPVKVQESYAYPFLTTDDSGVYRVDENTQITIELAAPVAVCSVAIKKQSFTALDPPQYAKLFYKTAGGSWISLGYLDVAPVGTVGATTNVQVFPRIRLRATQDNGISHATYKYYAHLYEFGIFSAEDAGGTNLATSAEILEASAGTGGSAVDGDDSTKWFHNVADFISITLGSAELVQARSARILFKDWVPNEVVLERWDGSAFVVMTTINPVSNVPAIINL